MTLASARRAALLSLTVFALVACGGAEVQRLSAQQFSSQANALCAQYLRELSFVPQPRVVTDFSPFANLVEPRVRRLADGLRELHPPAIEEPLFTQLVAVVDAQADSLHSVGEASRAGNQQRLAALQVGAAKAQNKWYRLAQRLQLDRCSQSPESPT